MPTTYAHDLFGKEVYKKLPSDMKALIRRHGDLYRIGLHGPDILFYYMVSKNPVTQFGIDCDASAIMLKNGKFVDRTDLVYFGNLKHKSGTVNHMGDNLTGEGEGDDEQIVIDLSRVPAEYDKIVIVVNIYQAVQRKQHFGMIENAFIRLVDARNNKEMCKYNLTENYSGMTAMIFGEIYRHNGEWKFNAMGNGTTDPGIGELCRRFS